MPTRSIVSASGRTCRLKFGNRSEPRASGRTSRYYSGFIAYTDLGGHDIYNPSPLRINYSWVSRTNGNQCASAGSISALPWDVKRRIARHELAHTIGFAHTYQYTYIGGTDPDPAFTSVMYSDPCSTWQTELSSDDIWSANRVYYLGGP